MGCGASAATTADQKGRQANGDVHSTKAPITNLKPSMKGDYSQFQLAKYHREKLQKERQMKLSLAADEFSGKVLEERERLSLGNRSRATSRNTSRTTSPTNNRRNTQPKEELSVPMTPVIEDRNRSESYRSDGSTLKSPNGATTQVETQEHKKKAKTKHKKKSNKVEKKSKGKGKKKSKKSKSKKAVSLESDDNDSGLEDLGNQNDNSDEIDSVDVEDKDTVQATRDGINNENVREIGVDVQSTHDTFNSENDDTKNGKLNSDGKGLLQMSNDRINLENGDTENGKIKGVDKDQVHAIHDTLNLKNRDSINGISKDVGEDLVRTTSDTTKFKKSDNKNDNLKGEHMDSVQATRDNVNLKNDDIGNGNVKVDYKDLHVAQVTHDSCNLENGDTKNHTVIGDNNHEPERDINNLPVSVDNNGNNGDINRTAYISKDSDLVNENKSVSKALTDCVGQPDSISN